jgi:hypothetical protein
MLESKVIEHCAPTLAGLKSANLFRYFFESKEIASKELKNLNYKLNEKGVFVEVMRWDENSVLVYTYRRSHLQKELKQEGVDQILSKYGYENCELDSCLQCLKSRLLEGDCFPHEIGLFLGYPLMDVVGFIQNEGRHCKCCGFWKVYCNECETCKLFAKLQRCITIYQRVFEEGRSIVQMTIQA